MGYVRDHMARHRGRAMWLIAAALLMRLLVPAGFMPDFSGGTISIALCSGHGVETMAMAMPGMTDHHGKPDHGRGEMPCGFDGHSPGSMATADPILLLAVILFVFATALREPVLATVREASFLRPPLRGPPTSA